MDRWILPTIYLPGMGHHGVVLAQGSKYLGPEQTAYDAEVAVIKAAFWQFEALLRFCYIVVHSDSTSAIS